MNSQLRRVLAAILAIGAFFSVSCWHSSRGKVLETWETANNTFKIRVTAYAENGIGFVLGAYYEFDSAPAGTNTWHPIMTFRHDDPVSIPREQVRFVDDRTGYVFMGWMYAVTTDGGSTWSVWNAAKDLPNWEYNYGLIREIRINSNGKGTMTLHPIGKRKGEVPTLCTKDYGRHWVPKCE